MEKRELRPLVLEFLRRVPHTHLHTLIAHVKETAADYERHDALRVHEIVWDLLLHGVLAPGKDSLNLSLPFLHVTDDGQRVLEEETLLLDPEDYLASLSARAGGPLDEAVLAYARESVLSFLAGRDRPCLELLALASERLLDLLAEATVCQIRSERGRTALRARLARAGRSLEERAAAVRKELQALRLPETSRETLDQDIAGLLALVRQSRDERGAPRLRRTDRETAHAGLLVFPGHCAGIFRLLTALRSGGLEGSAA